MLIILPFQFQTGLIPILPNSFPFPKLILIPRFLIVFEHLAFAELQVSFFFLNPTLFQTAISFQKTHFLIRVPLFFIFLQVLFLQVFFLLKS